MKKQVRIRAFTPEDYGEIIALWRESGLTIKPSDTLPEIAKLLALPSNLFLVAEAGAREMPPAIVGTVIGVWDGRRSWISSSLWGNQNQPAYRTRQQSGSGILSCARLFQSALAILL